MAIRNRNNKEEKPQTALNALCPQELLPVGIQIDMYIKNSIFYKSVTLKFCEEVIIVEIEGLTICKQESHQ
jgi:hypothetical protein